MKEQATLDITIERSPVQVIPQSDMASIRYMFHEMNQKYLDHEPATYYYTVKRILDVTLSALFIISIMPIF